MVLCMRLETTSPTTSLRRPAACCTVAPDCAFVSGMLLLLRSAGRGQFALARDGLHSRNVLAQAANLFQAFGLPHIELELQLEQLVAELVLLVPKFLSCQVSYFFAFHSQFSVLASLFA